MATHGLAGHEVEVEGLGHQRAQSIDAALEAERLGLLHDLEQTRVKRLDHRDGRRSLGGLRRGGRRGRPDPRWPTPSRWEHRRRLPR